MNVGEDIHETPERKASFARVSAACGKEALGVVNRKSFDRRQDELPSQMEE